MNHQKVFQQMISVGSILLYLVACSAPIASTPTLIPLSPTERPTSVPPTSTPDTDFESLIPSAAPLCETAFAAPVVGGSPQASVLTLIKEDGEHSWKYDESVASTSLEAASVPEVHTLACIEEDIFESATYTDGSSGYTRAWNLRLVGYPDGRVFHSGEIGAGPPTTKKFGIQAIAPRPMDKLSRWLMGSVNNTIFHVHNSNVAFAPDGKTLASAGPSVLLWDLSTGEMVRSLHDFETMITDLAFSPDGRLLAAASKQSDEITLLDSSTQEVMYTFKTKAEFIQTITFSPDGTMLASAVNVARGDGNVELWDVQTGKSVRTLSGYLSRVYDIAFSPDGKTLASSGSDMMVRIWEVSTGKILYMFSFDSIHAGNNIAFSPDGKTLISDDALVAYQPLRVTPVVQIWDFTSGKIVMTLTPPDDSGGVISMAFSPDGKILAAGLDYGSVQLWQMSDGTAKSLLGGFLGQVTTVAFLADGQTLAAIDRDGTVILSNLEE